MFFYFTIIYVVFSIGYTLVSSINNERWLRLQIGRFLREGKKLVVFGAGAGSRELLINLLKQGIKGADICNNDKEKWGTLLFEIMIKNLKN